MRLLLAVATLACAASLMVPAHGSAQNHHQIVVDQLANAAQLLGGEGFALDPDAIRRDRVVGLLPPGGTAFLEIQLVAGVDYLIVASCDFDCDDLDLRLFTPDGGESLAEDIEDDDTPLLSFKAPAGGRFVLAVDMPSCGESLCYYGFAVFRK